MASMYELMEPLRRAHFAKNDEYVKIREQAWDILLGLRQPFSFVLKELCCSAFLDRSVAVRFGPVRAGFLLKTFPDPNARVYSPWDTYVKPWPERLLEKDFEALSYETDPVALLAYAAHQEKVYIKIPDSEEVSFELLLGSSTRCHIEVGENAVVHLRIANSSSNPSNGLYSFDINCGGFVNITKTLSPASVDCLAERVWLNEGATYQETYVSSARLARNSLRATLYGKNSSIQLKSLAIVPSSAHVEGSFEIDQKAQESCSFVLHKAVVADGASSLFHSLCRLQAQQTVSHSYVHHLTLGKKAHIRAQPMFEILHDDVEAFHGCTSKDIDDEFMLYAASRGIDSRVATKLFVEGFCKEILKDPIFDDRYVSSIMEGLIF